LRPIVKPLKKHGWTAIRVVFAVFFFWLISHEIKGFPDIPLLIQRLREEPVWVWPLLGLLSALNWLTESFKWHILLKAAFPLPFRRSVQSTLAGAAVSNVIPFRVGEYIGRLMWVDSGVRIKAAALSVFGSLSQMMFTLVCGTIAGFCLPGLLPVNFRIPALLFILLFIGLALWLHRRRDSKRVVMQGKWWQIIQDMRVLSTAQIAGVTGLSMLRYAIFAGTYAWLLVQFGVCANLGEGLTYSAMIFFMQSFFPSVAALDVGVRVAVPLFLLPRGNETGIVAAALGIYVFNVLLPALAGLIAILRKRLQ
jgi:hypothetical protein